MSQNNRDLKEQLLNILPPPEPKRRIDFLAMEFISEDMIRVEKTKSFRQNVLFKGNNELYLELRRMIRILTSDPTWNVRYASQINGEAFPFLVSTATMKMIFDVMSPYRDPIHALLNNEPIHLARTDSKPYYFHKYSDIPKK